MSSALGKQDAHRVLDLRELSRGCARVQRDVCGGAVGVLASFWEVSLFWKGYCQDHRRMIWLLKWTAFVGYDIFKFHFDFRITRVALLPMRLYYCNSQGWACSRAFLQCAQNSNYKLIPLSSCGCLTNARPALIHYKAAKLTGLTQLYSSSCF